MQPQPNPQKARALIVPLLLVAGLAVGLAFTVPAGAAPNSGSIKVHDDATASPPTRNEPHVEGDFWIEGSNMAVDGGALRVYSWPPTGDRTLVLDTTWSADGGEPANHFLAGPFTLPCGHYRAEAQNQGEHTKNKMFWVEGCEQAPPPCGTEGQPPCEQPPCGTEGQPPCEQPPCGTEGQPPCEQDELACPAGLTATANADETVTLRWTPTPGSDGTNVYSAQGSDDLVYVTTLGPGVATWTDSTTTAGNGYAYSVTALKGDEESSDCPLAEVTAIPVFPSAVAFGLATVLGAGAYLGLSVRRKP